MKLIKFKVEWIKKVIEKFKIKFDSNDHSKEKKTIWPF